MAVTQNLHAIFYLEEAILGCWQKILPTLEIAGHGLDVAASEPRVRHKFAWVEVAFRSWFWL